MPIVYSDITHFLSHAVLRKFFPEYPLYTIRFNKTWAANMRRERNSFEGTITGLSRETYCIQSVYPIIKSLFTSVVLIEKITNLYSVVQTKVTYQAIYLEPLSISNSTNTVSYKSKLIQRYHQTVGNS